MSSSIPTISSSTSIATSTSDNYIAPSNNRNNPPPPNPNRSRNHPNSNQAERMEPEKNRGYGTDDEQKPWDLNTLSQIYPEFAGLANLAGGDFGVVAGGGNGTSVGSDGYGRGNGNGDGAGSGRHGGGNGMDGGNDGYGGGSGIYTGRDEYGGGDKREMARRDEDVEMSDEKISEEFQRAPPTLPDPGISLHQYYQIMPILHENLIRRRGLIAIPDYLLQAEGGCVTLIEIKDWVVQCMDCLIGITTMRLATGLQDYEPGVATVIPRSNLGSYLKALSRSYTRWREEVGIIGYLDCIEDLTTECQLDKKRCVMALYRQIDRLADALMNLVSSGQIRPQIGGGCRVSGTATMDFDLALQTTFTWFYRIHPGLNTRMVVYVQEVRGMDEGQLHILEVPDNEYWDEGFDVVRMTEQMRLGRGR